MDAIGADVRVVGVGGAGGNAVRHMASLGLEGARLIAANTDAQALEGHPAEQHLMLGRRSTRGLGAGGRPSVGFTAAQESTAEIVGAVAGADLVFVAAGLGGGTGTGAAPRVARIARGQGALVVGVVTTPFTFEGGRRNRFADEGLEALREQVDSLIVIPNDRLLELNASEPTVAEAFARADGVLADGVRGIGDLVMEHGLINLDFADVSAVLSDGGRAVMGIGYGRGPQRALRAIEMASRSPLLADDSIEGARGVLMSFRVDPCLGIGKIHEAAARVQALVDDDAEILFGVTVDTMLEDEVQVTLVAAGLDGRAAEAPAPVETPRSSEIYAPAMVAKRRNALVMLR